MMGGEAERAKAVILKVMSSEMDQAKSGLIRKLGKARRFSDNFARPHSVRGNLYLVKGTQD
jgi:hypothetical protein